MPEKLDITKQISLLVSLQAIDSQIYTLKDQKQKKPQEIVRLAEDFKGKAAALKKTEENVTALQLKKKEKEMALGTKEEGIKKLQAQLYQIKTNKEYSVMQKEIEGQKADNSAMEDQILFLMDEIDKAKAEAAKEKEILAAEEEKLKQRQKQAQDELAQIEKKIGELDAEREIIAKDADKSLLNKYNRILVGKNGLAIVPVDNGVCFGCHMSLPPQVINEVRMKERFIVCETCARLLYVKEQ